MVILEEAAGRMNCPMGVSHATHAIRCTGSFCMAWQYVEDKKGRCGMAFQGMAGQIADMQKKLPELIAAAREALNGDRLDRLTDENINLRAALVDCVDWMEQGGKNNNQQARDLVEAGRVAIYGPRVPGVEL